MRRPNRYFNYFPQLRGSIRTYLKRAAHDAAEHSLMVARRNMQASTPGPSRPGRAPAIVTGRLYDSGEVSDFSAQNYGSRASFQAPYAPYLEYGTSRMAARPFMAPAADETAPVYNQLVRAEIARWEKDQT